MFRPRLISASAALIVACCVGVAAAAPPDDVEQVTTTLPTLNPGQTAWVSTLWRGAPTDATEFELTADPPKGITVSYPENTGGYSSLYKQSTLLADDTDYAAFKVQVGDDVVGEQTIKLKIKYRLTSDDNSGGNGNGNNGNGNGNCGGNGNNGGGNGQGNQGNGNGGDREVTRNLKVTLPVVAFVGPTVEQVTTSVGPIKAGTAAWVDVSYKANKPGVTNAKLTVKPPTGGQITYPNEGTSTGFAADTTLSVGETDSASFKVDTATLQPGNHTLRLDLAYGTGQHLPGTVTLAVS